MSILRRALLITTMYNFFFSFAHSRYIGSFVNISELRNTTNYGERLADCALFYEQTCLRGDSPCKNNSFCAIDWTKCEVACLCVGGFVGKFCNESEFKGKNVSQGVGNSFTRDVVTQPPSHDTSSREGIQTEANATKDQEFTEQVLFNADVLIRYKSMQKVIFSTNNVTKLEGVTFASHTIIEEQEGKNNKSHATSRSPYATKEEPIRLFENSDHVEEINVSVPKLLLPKTNKLLKVTTDPPSDTRTTYMGGIANTNAQMIPTKLSSSNDGANYDHGNSSSNTATDPAHSTDTYVDRFSRPKEYISVNTTKLTIEDISSYISKHITESVNKNKTESSNIYITERITEHTHDTLDKQSNQGINNRTSKFTGAHKQVNISKNSPNIIRNNLTKYTNQYLTQKITAKSSRRYVLNNTTKDKPENALKHNGTNSTDNTGGKNTTDRLGVYDKSEIKRTSDNYSTHTTRIANHLDDSLITHTNIHTDTHTIPTVNIYNTSTAIYTSTNTLKTITPYNDSYVTISEIINKLRTEPHSVKQNTYKVEQMQRDGLRMRQQKSEVAQQHKHTCIGIPRDVFNCGFNGRCYLARRGRFVLPKCKCKIGWIGKNCKLVSRYITTIKNTPVQSWKTRQLKTRGTTISNTRIHLQDFAKMLNTTVSLKRRDLCNGISEWSFSCMRHGTCRLNDYGGGMMVPACDCDVGWVGRFCHQRCRLKCLNGGKCINLYNRASVCSCGRHFTGKLCEQNVRRLGIVTRPQRMYHSSRDEPYERLINWILV